jgi:hypothetical protein
MGWWRLLLLVQVWAIITHYLVIGKELSLRPFAQSALKSRLNSSPNKWIVHLLPNCSHQYFSSAIDTHFHRKKLLKKPLILHQYHHVLHGLAIQDVEESTLQELSCVKSYVRDSIKRLVSVPSWGLDRIDQEDLPLDDTYETTFSGQNVDGPPLLSPPDARLTLLQCIF